MTGADFWALPEGARELILALPAEELADVREVIEVRPFCFELRPHDLGVEVWIPDAEWRLGTYREESS